MARQLQFRRGDLSWWTTANPVLADGEFVLVSTNNDNVWNAYKIGDGVSAFSTLPLREYTGVLGYGSPQGVYSTLEDLIAANPNRMYIYIVQADGNWYYWDTSTSQWTTGGLYQTPLSVVSDYGTSNVDVINQNKLSSDFQRFSPTLRYGSRVLADFGSIKDLDRLTELYMNQLNLLPYTHFMWDGNAGYKVVDGKLTKVYSMDNAGNDGTTSAGTEPYAGGLIAPNESLKAKALIQEKSILIPSKSYLSTDKWSITFSIKQFDFVNSIINGGTILFFNESDLRYYNGSTEYVFYDVIDNNEIGKTINYTVVANGNGVMSLYKNGIYFSSISAVSNANFNTLLSDAYGHINNCELNSISVISKALSAHEIQLQHELLRLQHPEIEGIDIGNQHWATSNYEGVVTGNGTVIPEYKYNAANSPEIVPLASSTFETDGTAWWGDFLAIKSYDATNQCMLVTSENDVYSQIYKSTNIIQNFQANKIYHYKFDVKSNDYNGVLSIGYSKTLINTISNPAITNTYQTIEYISTWGALFASWTNGTTLSIDNVSIKEVGWDELTTPGWCYYNNDNALGAVYGKLYNWYAVAEIAKNPPAGWRVPSDADIIQYYTYLGGASVAGKKSKAQYGIFNNSNATNESGLSILPSGIRTATGIFEQNNATWIHTSDNAHQYRITYNYDKIDIFSFGGSIIPYGFSIRLLKNSPVGKDTKIVSTGRFATDISVTPKAIAIPFGYKVENILINSANALTGVTASLYNYSDALQNELLASTTVDANVPNIFDIGSHKMLLQDGYVKVLATGNTGDGMTIDIVLKKIQ